MDYLLRDSLFCGVRYGTFDLERLLDTMLPIADPETGEWGIGVDEGGVHALEALVMARYYMFTQVYFNVTGKALELHLNEWLAERGPRWPADAGGLPRPGRRLGVVGHAHARPAPTPAPSSSAATTPRLRDPRAPHRARRRSASRRCSPRLRGRFGAGSLLVSNSAKDPHRLGRAACWCAARRLARADGAA